MGCVGRPQEKEIVKYDGAAATCHPGEAFGADLDERWSSIVVVRLTHTAKHS